MKPCAFKGCPRFVDDKETFCYTHKANKDFNNKKLIEKGFLAGIGGIILYYSRDIIRSIFENLKKRI